MDRKVENISLLSTVPKYVGPESGFVCMQMKLDVTTKTITE
jgi:hypothetical protein